MAQKMVGQGLNVGKLGGNSRECWMGNWGSWEQGTGSKEPFHPACPTVVELSATKMDVAMFIKEAETQSVRSKGNPRNLCARSENIGIWIQF